jgi:hypothetical protein
LLRAWDFAASGGRRLLAYVRALRAALPVADLAPLLLCVALLPWVAIGCRHWWNYGVLFRDVNMYQYGAWCLLKGERLYRDFATPDGPLIFIIHALIQLVSKRSEQDFRRVDLVLNAAIAFGVGVLLAPKRRGRRRYLIGPVWGLAHALIWLTFLLHPNWQLSAQRENFYVLLGMAGVVLVYRAATMASSRVQTALFVAGGVLTSVQMFGKHTGVIYVVLGALALWPDPATRSRFWRFLARYAIGVGAGCALMVAFLGVFGSLRGFAFWYFRYDLLVYRYEVLWATEDLLAQPGMAQYGRMAVTGLVGGGAAVAFGLLPRRALVFAIAPTLHYAAGIVQAKGWQYQFMPSLASLHLLFTVALAAFWRDGDSAARARGTSSESGSDLLRACGASPESGVWTPLRAAGATALMFFVSTRCLEDVQPSPWMAHPKTYKHAYDDAELKDPRDAAAALANLTGPDDRVFFYGNDPIVPFLAERLPASPFAVPWMVSFHLSKANEDSDPDIPTPDDAHFAVIQRMEHALEADLCTRLLRTHPKAMAFIGGWDEVLGYCPDLGPVINQSYRVAFEQGQVRIYAHK